MNPTIQLIQLTVRFEREEQVQRQLITTNRDDFTNVPSSYLRQLNGRIKQILNPPHRQQCCQCA